MEITLSEVARRLTDCESDIKSLFSHQSKTDVAQAQTVTKLDNVLVSLGELKESINTMKDRPANLWDKLIFAVIGAAAAGFVAWVLR